MARTVRDSKLETRSSRDKLSVGAKPHWRTLRPRELHLGYRKRRSGAAGVWLVRQYERKDGPGSPYKVRLLGLADDYEDADGTSVLSFKEAQDQALKPYEAASGADRARYTVNQAADDYLAYLRDDGRDESAIKDARYRIDAFIGPLLGKCEVAALRPEQLRRWRADLAKEAPRLRTKAEDNQRHRKSKDERARKATANRTLTTLKALLNHAFDEERVSSNKAWGRRVKPFENVETARVRYLKVDEAKRLINACDPGFRPMVMAALQTGARYSELARLRGSDFDADAGTVFIQKSKGGKERHVVLSAEGVKFFRQVCLGRPGDSLMFRNEERVGRKAGASKKVAVIELDEGEWRKSEQARPMSHACERAKIKPAIGFHILRHTWATLAVQNGAPLHVVAKNLGHLTKDGQPDLRMVTRHYAHFENTHIAEMVRKHAPRFGLKASRVVSMSGANS